jgi:hypothetical protein
MILARPNYLRLIAPTQESTMLVAFEDGRTIDSIPYRKDFELYCSRLTATDIAGIKQALHGMIDGTSIQTAGWMPGDDWTDTPFDPIYAKAAKYDYATAAKCFGLFVWVVFMERPERWYTGRFEMNGEPLSSRTYFRSRDD